MVFDPITLLASIVIVACFGWLTWQRGYTAGVAAMKQNRLIQAEVAKAYHEGYEQACADANLPEAQARSQQ